MQLSTATLTLFRSRPWGGAAMRRWGAWLVLAALLINLMAPLRAPVPVLDDLLHAVCTANGMVQDPPDGQDTAPGTAPCVFCLPLLHGGPVPVAAGLAAPVVLAAVVSLLPAALVFSPRPAPGPAAPRAPPR
jgi:hypothetical protein